MSDTGAPTKGQILAAIERERAGWEETLVAVGEARMLQPGAMGEWSFKDLVAHLTGWRARTLRRFEAAASGQPEPPTPWPAALQSDDEINAWIYEENRGRLLGEVVGESRESFARLAEVVQMLPEEALADPARFPELEGAALGQTIVDGSFFAHWHEEHEPEVRHWLNEAG